MAYLACATLIRMLDFNSTLVCLDVRVAEAKIGHRLLLDTHFRSLGILAELDAIS